MDELSLSETSGATVGDVGGGKSRTMSLGGFQ